MTKLPYQNGTWFLVPLRRGGYGLGIVARHNRKGGVFGYFFGPKLDTSALESAPHGRSANDRVLWGIFGDLGLLKGEWPIIGSDPNWNPDSWPMPAFVRVDRAANIAFLSEYDPNTLKCLTERKCNPELASDHPPDSTMGYGLLESRLTDLLDPL